MTRQEAAAFLASMDHASKHLNTAHGDRRMKWRIWGSGPPLVLLHGSAGSWMHWVRNIEELKRYFTLIVPDIPGFGDSDMPAEPVSAGGIAKILNDGMNSIIGAEQRFALAGFSMGGLIAAYLAGGCSQNVTDLILVGTMGTNAPRATEVTLQSWKQLTTEADKYEVHRKNLSLLMLYQQTHIDDIAVSAQQHSAQLARLRYISRTGSLSDGLAQYDGRLTAIWGEHDATAVPYLAERIADLQKMKPLLRFDVLPAAGHWVQYEASHQFNPSLRELLQTSF